MAYNYNNFLSRFGVFCALSEVFTNSEQKDDFGTTDLIQFRKTNMKKQKKLQICLGSFEKGRKYHSNRDYSLKSLHQIIQSKFLQFSRYESDNDKK